MARSDIANVLMEIFAMPYNCKYCVITLYGRISIISPILFASIRSMHVHIKYYFTFTTRNTETQLLVNVQIVHINPFYRNYVRWRCSAQKYFIKSTLKTNEKQLLVCLQNALLQIMDFSCFLLPRRLVCSLSYQLFNVYSLLLCPFHKKLVICKNAF